jgi:hypothetical protein
MMAMHCYWKTHFSERKDNYSPQDKRWQRKDAKHANHGSPPYLIANNFK